MDRGRIFAAIVGVIAAWLCDEAPRTATTVPNDPPALETNARNVTDRVTAVAVEGKTRPHLGQRAAARAACSRQVRPRFHRDRRQVLRGRRRQRMGRLPADFRNQISTPPSRRPGDDSPTLKADRIIWLCSEPSASRLVPNHGVWIRGVKIEDKINLYRCTIPYSLTFYDCLLDNGLNIRNAKLQELDISNCCSAKIDARGVQVAENVYLLKSTVFGGLDFIEAQIAGDLDMDGGLAFHGMSADDVKKPGVAINLYDAKIDGDVKLGGKFRAFGRVRLNGARIGRSLACAGGRVSTASANRPSTPIAPRCGAMRLQRGLQRQWMRRYPPRSHRRRP